MPDRTEIANRLLQSGLKLVGDVVQDTGDDSKYFAFTRVTRDDNGSQRPSNHALRKIMNSLLEQHVQITFILIEDDRGDILANVKAMLLRTFPELVRNVFPTFSGQGVVIWIEAKKILEADETASLVDKSREFLGFLKTRLISFQVTSSQNTPTRTAVLNSIRIHSPVSLQILRADLQKRGFDVPNDAWFANMLDKLRKAELILWRKDGHYVLTLHGLEALGSAKNRRSPDVLRALELARRGG